jgi:hypothetical protein
MASVRDQSGMLKSLKERYRDAPPGQPTAAALARWFLDDPDQRTISPLSTVRAKGSAQGRGSR